MSNLFNTRILFDKRIICFILVFSLLFVTLLDSRVYASQPISSTESYNSASFQVSTDKFKLYVGSSIGFMGAEWSSSRKAWGFNYRFAGVGASEANGSPFGLIRIADMTIEGTSNTSKLAFWTSSDSRYIGSVPASSGSSANFSDVALGIVGLAISTFAGYYTGFAWSASTLVAAMKSTVNTSTTNTHDLCSSFHLVVKL